MASLKTCRRCHNDKPFEAFQKGSGTHGLHSWCKECNREAYRDRKAASGKTCENCGVSIKWSAKFCKVHIRKSATDKRGYVRLYGYADHPNASKGGRIFQHVLVMAEHLGRPLLPEENVHHKNGVRHDNRIENLELWSTTQPSGQRVEDKVAWAKELLALYEPESLNASPDL